MKISDLFYEYIVENQFLNIPDFGKFESEKTEPYIHPIDHEMSPGNLKLIFRLDKNVKDNGFIDFAAKKLNNTESEIINHLKCERDEWIISLKKNEDIVFDQVGKLRLVKSGAVVFEQDKNAIFIKEFFGLSSFSMKPLQTIQKEIKSPDALVLVKKRSFFGFGFWIAAASIVVLLGMGYWFFGDKIFNRDKNTFANQIEDQPMTNLKQNQNKTEITPIDSSKSTDSNSIPEIDDVKIDTVLDSVPNNEVEAPVQNAYKSQSVKNQVVNGSMSYLVVAGCFQSENKANEYLASLLEKGYNASIEGTTSGGLFRVCSGRYSNWSEAAKASNLYNKKENSTSWVQKIEQ